MQKFSRELIAPTQQFMDQNQVLNILRARTCMSTILFPPTTSKISLWTLLDQLPKFWNSADFISFVFLFGKLIVDLIVMALRHMEIHGLSGASPEFGRTLLSACFIFFFYFSIFFLFLIFFSFFLINKI